jgi:hypothetical protein
MTKLVGLQFKIIYRKGKEIWQLTLYPEYPLWCRYKHFLKSSLSGCRR